MLLGYSYYENILRSYSAIPRDNKIYYPKKDNSSKENEINTPIDSKDGEINGY